MAMSVSFFENLKSYVGFTSESSAALRELHPVAQPFFAPIVEDFYAAIEAHPDARSAITGGPAQIERLKQTLMRWLDKMLLGPHDEAYYELRARIGRIHVRIALPQQYMFTAMDRDPRQAFRRRSLEGRRSRSRPSASRRLSIRSWTWSWPSCSRPIAKTWSTMNRNTERLATIGQFGVSIGHELRNPLSVIDSSLFLLRQHLGPEVSSARDVAKHLDRIANEVTRANKTINDLLDLARNRPPQLQRVAARKLVDAAVRASSLPGTVDVEIVTSPAELVIEVDPDQIHQVLVNLLTNAAQAMPDGGHVEVRTEPALDGSGAQLRVLDDGPGVPADVRHRIFEALFTTKAKGTGLGLALCRRIMEAHGGTIDLEAREQGTSFVLGFPAVASSPQWSSV